MMQLHVAGQWLLTGLPHRRGLGVAVHSTPNGSSHRVGLICTISPFRIPASSVATSLMPNWPLKQKFQANRVSLVASCCYMQSNLV